METEKEEVILSEVGTSESQTKLVWSREPSDNFNSPFRLKWQFFKKLFRFFFILDSDSFNWSGYCPSFEKEVLFDKCKSCTFSFSRLFWERVYKETRPLNSSIRAKRLSKPISW